MDAKTDGFSLRLVLCLRFLYQRPPDTSSFVIDECPDGRTLCARDIAPRMICTSAFESQPPLVVAVPRSCLVASARAPGRRHRAPCTCSPELRAICPEQRRSACAEWPLTAATCDMPPLHQSVQFVYCVAEIDPPNACARAIFARAVG